MRRWLVMLIVLTGCGQPAADGDPDPGPRRVEATGTVIAAEGGPVMLCHTVLESYPPQCGGGVELDGVDPAELPGAVTESGVTFTERGLRLAGTLSDGILAVDEVEEVTPTEDPDPGERPDHPDADAARAQGDIEAIEAVTDYATDHDDTYAGRWFDAPDRPGTLVVAFTDRIAEHESALSGIWPHDLEVERAEHTLAELQATAEQVSQATGELSDDGVDLLTVGVDERANTVGVEVVLADDRAMERLGRVADPDLLDVRGWLRVAE